MRYMLGSSCDKYCPVAETLDSEYVQNLGCLPCPYDIRQMLKEKRVWMCHSNQAKPCVGTGLQEVPEGYVKVLEY